MLHTVIGREHNSKVFLFISIVVRPAMGRTLFNSTCINLGDDSKDGSIALMSPQCMQPVPR